MIRFSTFSEAGNISGGVPYVNTDFSHVLQLEHLKAYGSILDGINQESFDSDINNSGIILSGCKINSFSSPNYVMDFRNSIVYINGEFYQNLPSYTTTTNISGDFYLIPVILTGGTVSRPLRYDFVTQATFSVTSYFKHVTTQPTTPYIKFSQGGTSRYYKRILKYFTSTPGDIYVAKNKNNFNNNGIGFNDMEGFVLMDDQNVTPNIPDLSGKFLRGRENLSNTVLFAGSATHSLNGVECENHIHETSGPLYSSNWNVVNPKIVPMDTDHIHFFNTSTVEYDVISNTNTNQQQAMNPLPPWSTCGNPDLPISPVNYEYPPPGAAADGQFTYPSTPAGKLPTPATIDGITYNSRYAMNDTGSMFKWYPLGLKNSFDPTDFPQQYNPEKGPPEGGAVFSGGISDYTNSQLAKHRHTIGGYDLGSKTKGELGLPHENRPPYRVVVYYRKK